MNANILLIRLRSIGDILFTLPAVYAVRDAFPNARLSFLTAGKNAPLIEGFRGVDEVIRLDYERFRRKNPLAILGETVSLLRRLRAGRFSHVVDFQGYGETAWLTRFTGASERWGTVYRSKRRWAFTRGIPHDSRMHPIDWNLALLRECGLAPGHSINEFCLPERALTGARDRMALLALDLSRPVLFVQPFTSGPAKNWPVDRYLAVARHAHQTGIQILFAGGPDDQAALEPARQAGFPVAAGNDILVSAGMMKLSTLILGGDTGMLHLAVALNKRVLMVIGALHPGRSWPYQHRDWTVTPERRQPLSSLETDKVMDSTMRALAELGVRGVPVGR